MVLQARYARREPEFGMERFKMDMKPIDKLGRCRAHP
jgi:hypothetical protein